ncbi:MAG: Adenylate kinase [Parcubacteria group bacterium GW2011_GWC2_42_6]|nr:MAG: Adenylate kinase [Parcubacteria group bacterium GW2011_GWA2_42_11]KKS68447.1 MAG: Adenylate kinase [Parcubacteria group bacterium GW2011_GWC2_42_6]KKT76519.1 MAG: Adenylate kinase [Parcubacteria group bacterium GW2011_GWF2_44_7]
MDQPQIIIILGRQGCGKGTQAKLLVNKFGLEYIGSGDLLRERLKASDFTGDKLKNRLGEGKLAPTPLIFFLWYSRLQEIKKSLGDDFGGIIFDGTPRMLTEAQLLDETLEWFEWNKNIKVILIDFPREEAFKRIASRRICAQCGHIVIYKEEMNGICPDCGGQLIIRDDDQPEAINRRLDWFDTEVMPVIKHYEKKGLLVKVNGLRTIEEVQTEILSKL